MVNVLWGLTAMKVDSQCTAADVLAEFREAMQLDGKHQVDVYRLVPMDPSTEVVAEEMLMVHLPCSPFDCKAIEETYQQLQDAEIRNERCQESVMALAEALRVSEMSAEPTEDVQRLQQENSTLRNQLESCEFARRRSEQNAQSCGEVTQELTRGLGDVRHDIQRRPVTFSPSPPLISGDGVVGVAPCPAPMPFPNNCLGTGSAPVTPRIRLPLRPAMVPHTMSAAAPSGRSMATMAQNHFVRRESRTIEMPQHVALVQQPFVQPYVPVPQQVVPGRKVTKGGNTFGRR